MAKAKSQPHAILSPTTLTSTGSPGPGPEANSSLPSTSTGAAAVSGTTRPEPDNTSSHNISISSITEDEDGNTVDDDDGSSAFESSGSDSEGECDNEQIKKAIERIPNTLQPGTSQLVRLPAAEAAVATTAAMAIQERPNIGSIAVQNSSDITFGNKTYIKGQVVIKNIYHDRKANGVGGVVNEGYRETDGEAGLPSKFKKDPTSSSQPAEPLTWRSSLKTIIRDKPLLSAIILMALMLMVVTIATVVYVTTSAGKPRLRPHYGDGDDDRAYVPPDTGIADDFLPDAKPLRIVTRNEWLAQPPREKLDDLKLPVHKVIIAHTATEECTTQSECVATTSRIQKFHMAPDSKNFDDIGYNFLVGADGNAYEGRGWDKQGAHTKGFNTDSICIAFIGTFTDIEAPVTQLSAARQLIALGVELGKVDKHYQLYGHRQLAPFESPGRKLYEVIKTWPHWSNKFPSQWEDKVKVANGSAGTS